MQCPRGRSYRAWKPTGIIPPCPDVIGSKTIEVPHAPPTEWIAAVRRLVPRPLTASELETIRMMMDKGWFACHAAEAIYSDRGG